MFIENKSFYRKFVDWWNDFVKNKPLITAGANDAIFGICFLMFVILAIVFDPIWRPFLHYYFPDSIPLMNYPPYNS